MELFSTGINYDAIILNDVKVYEYKYLLEMNEKEQVIQLSSRVGSMGGIQLWDEFQFCNYLHIRNRC